LSGAVKTGLIIGGAAVGVFVLLKVLAPAKAAPKSSGFSLTSILGTGGLGGAGSALAGLFKGGSSSGDSPGASLSSFAGPSASDVRAAGFNPGDSVSSTDGFAFTDNTTGGFIAG
jgi:hypothetical protein